MKLTTKGRYAVTAMLDLALHDGKGPITLSDVASRQHISLSYLEQLFARLRKRSLVSSVRGPGGGYALGRDMRDISVAEVIAAVDENLDTTSCGGSQNCQRDKRCLTHDLWNDLSTRIYEYLNGISLHDLVMSCGVQKTSEHQDRMADRSKYGAAADQLPGTHTRL